jgi:hypothetical protein
MNNISNIISISAIAIVSFFNVEKIYPDSAKLNAFLRFFIGLLFAFFVILLIKLMLSLFEFLKENGPKFIKRIIVIILHPILKIIYLILTFIAIIYLSNFDFYITLLCIFALIISLSSIRWLLVKAGYIFNDTFDNGLGSWKIITGNPSINQKFGKPAPSLGLTVIPGIRTNCFMELLNIDTPRKGTIECDVYLEPNSLLNIVFKGDMKNKKWYMARLDTRGRETDKDAFLKNRGQNWEFIKTSNENSVPRIWHKMKIGIDGSIARLFKNGKLIAEIDDEEFKNGKIGIFNEIGEVFIDNFSVKKVN